MINFLHTFHPNPILFQLGPISVHWYGLVIVFGIILAILIAVRLGKEYKMKKDDIFDLSFYLIVFGIIGARLYDVGLEWQYYQNNLVDIFKIWNGGLAIHGAIIGGLIVVWGFAATHVGNKPLEERSKEVLILKSLSMKQRLLHLRGRFAMTKKGVVEKFWLLCSLVVPGLALAYAIGRWGNYFNQEIFGYPTNLPWGIPIDLMRRPIGYTSADYFHPTFLYEFLGSLVIFIILILMHLRIIRQNKLKTRSYQLIVLSYLIMYSILRFGIEFIRIDWAPTVLGLRWPQIASLIIIAICGVILLLPKFKKGDSL
jgi:phosphatidylglycerol:prolipoprotein diacylglycerol transferase